MQTITVHNQDVRLNVHIAGKKDAPVVLFLHGFPDDHRTWHHQVSALKAQYRVVTFDMRGVGESSAPLGKNAYQVNNLLTDIEAVIDAVVGHDGQVHLVGHDWGSVIGWSFVAEPYYAQRVRSFVSVSGPHLGLMLNWARRNILSGKAQRILNSAKQAAFSWYVAFFNVPLVPECLVKRMGLSMWKRLLTQNGVAFGDAYLKETTQNDVENIMLRPLALYRQNPLRPPSMPKSHGVTVPVHLVIAERDAFIRPELFEHYDEYVPNLTRTTLPAKHWLHHSHWIQFNDIIDQHVRRAESQVQPDTKS